MFSALIVLALLLSKIVLLQWSGATASENPIIASLYISSTLKNSSEGSAGVLGYFVDIYGFGETSSAFETFRIIPERTTYK